MAVVVVKAAEINSDSSAATVTVVTGVLTGVRAEVDGIMGRGIEWRT